ncbi:unnamed protein product [Tuber melanosporum]|jgi:hypothetical protein|uniref:(Perigord truffle) hypothetical protein n=1 Tax=Tuber melanosporum (strain Mel28) TaxID=656061 RepID=D5GI51_TUBMM|nr:uncharacterized protein GSTUM_00008278001 [Tuber melanosporum]CAZ84194.1 unnamed protein product [Tuber melanosporum]
MSSQDTTTQDTTQAAAAAPASEQEPLLGRPGDVAQGEGEGLLRNLVAGTASLAQIGGLVLVALVWGAVFTHRILVPFSLHPLLNSLAILFALEAILVLQPTHTPDQRQKGTYTHASFVGLAALCFYGALAAVLVHKKRAGLPHFESPHAILGVIIYSLLLLQAFIGFTQYFVPGLYGGVGNAKVLYKYHRISGYLLLTLFLVNLILASLIDYGRLVLNLKTWGVALVGVLIVAGVFPRIKKQKIRIF